MCWLKSPCNSELYFKNIDSNITQFPNKNMFVFFQLTAYFNIGHHALGTLTSVMFCSFSFFLFLPAKFICICFLSFTCLLALQRSLPLGPLSRLCWLRVSVDPQISLLLAPLLKVTAHPLYALFLLSISLCFYPI